MSMDLRTGSISSSDGSVNSARADRTGALVVAQGHGRYTEATLRGSLFCAANQASRTFTLFDTTAATGFILFNPVGSGQNLILMNVSYVRATAAAAAISQLVLSSLVGITHATTTAETVRNCFVGGPANATAVGVVYRISTISAAGVIVYALTSPSVSATATTDVPPVVSWDFDGAFVIAPGNGIQLAAALTNTVDGIASMIWEEQPI